MQNQTKSTTQDHKPTNYFRYEMKDTNQLLKDFISCNMAHSFHHSQLPNNQTNMVLPKIEESLLLNDYHTFQYKSNKKETESVKESGKKALKSEEDLQNQQNSNLKSFIEDNSLTDSRKNKRQNSMEDLILQKFYLYSSENQDFDEGFKGSIQKYKSKDNLDNNFGDRYEDSYKEIKKQRKGLANISLRVKNIVSEHKKLTYKQVSDYVLQCSQEEIKLLDPVQRTKEVKNIKRRVYDALNVLVAVGILGKHQRCVCITQWTDIPGKKHSSEWHKINAKIEYLAKLKRNCIDKAQVLEYQIEKYYAITALRNKHMQEGSQEQNSKENIRTQNFQEKSDLKLIFPVIVFCPGFGEDPNEKLSVVLEEEEQNDKNEKEGVKRSKIKVSGKNMTMLGDFDCALEMELKSYRVQEQEMKIIKEIQDYANEVANKRSLNPKLQTDDLEQASIEEYFNDQMFQSK